MADYYQAGFEDTLGWLHSKTAKWTSEEKEQAKQTAKEVGVTSAGGIGGGILGGLSGLALANRALDKKYPRAAARWVRSPNDSVVGKLIQKLIHKKLTRGAMIGIGLGGLGGYLLTQRGQNE